ncbi:hypothetical protein Mp_4g13160 [Marchantia polymorpha subsp. ruderalis]|uniref:ATP-dependent RNA helicase n=2 Tax=Marchantia polymorpha TaxID=3197 RepID=A0AAF6B9F5_MARPO|nr:hypothetical protein MARPO_3797s0001 [Marchantia polymorpha]BBN08639.1 hypothetical protein Mp_4g13160 [Marchantia polymorpha subsp. ruderalis]|eukprot:PTQ26257.1 hypothetical protein MARPO_3797s0001 [Marchantia polymorpha]
MWIESWVVMLIWFQQSRKTTGRCCHGCVIRLILMPTRPPPRDKCLAWTPDFKMLSMPGIQSLFPVQMAVWHETVGPGFSERDFCVSSPTGSGKTLSYALPIVQKLSSRVIRLLRVLVVLPTRDLAAQVRNYPI